VSEKNPTIIISRFSTVVLPLVALVAGLLTPPSTAAKVALAISSLPLLILVANVLLRYRRDPLVLAATSAIIVELMVLAYLRAS